MTRNSFITKDKLIEVPYFQTILIDSSKSAVELGLVRLCSVSHLVTILTKVNRQSD